MGSDSVVMTQAPPSCPARSSCNAVTVPAGSPASVAVFLGPRSQPVVGLVALMLLTDAREPAPTARTGQPVPLAEQDRSRWDRAKIDEGAALIAAALAQGSVGPYQLQAATGHNL